MNPDASYAEIQQVELFTRVPTPTGLGWVMSIDFLEVEFRWQLARLHHLGPLPWEELERKQIQRSAELQFDFGAEPLVNARAQKLIGPVVSEWGQELYDVTGKGRVQLGLNRQYRRPVHVLTAGLLRQVANEYVVQMTRYFYRIPDTDHRTGNSAARKYITGYNYDPDCQVLARLDDAQTLTDILDNTLQKNFLDDALVFTADDVAQVKLQGAFDGRVTAVPWSEVRPLLSEPLRDAFDQACDHTLGRTL